MMDKQKLEGKIIKVIAGLLLASLGGQSQEG
jgi:hypothetical protein